MDIVAIKLVRFILRFHPKVDCHKIFGQAIQKHGEFLFTSETLREMTFKIWPLKVPEMTIFVSEYKLHKIDDSLRREIVKISEFLFYHDEDEDFATKLRLTIRNPNRDVVMRKYFSQFSSFNASYQDDESYLDEGDYIYEDATLEELLKNEDLSGLFEGPNPFEISQSDGVQDSQDNEDISGLFEGPDPFESSKSDGVQLQDSQDIPNLLIPSTNCEERLPDNFDSSPDGGNLIPEESLGEEDQFKDLLSEPLLYDF